MVQFSVLQSAAEPESQTRSSILSSYPWGFKRIILMHEPTNLELDSSAYSFGGPAAGSYLVVSTSYYPAHADMR